MSQKHTLAAFNLALLLFCSVSAKATNFNYAAEFNKNNKVQFFNSIAATSTNLNIQNLSFDDRISAAGDSTDKGGFTPYLALFNRAHGTWFHSNNKPGGTDAVFLNADFFGSLIAENYILAVSQFDKSAVSGYLPDSFTNNIGLTNVKSTPTETGGVGSSNWPLDKIAFDTAKTTNTPTSVALTLLLVSLIGLAITTQHKARSAIASIF